MKEENKYIYGVIGTSEHRDFGPIGLSAAEDMVQTISYRDVAAVVSNSPSVDYTTLDKESLMRQLAAHQAVIEKVMEEYSVLPVKFGTRVRSTWEVEEVLKTAYGEFKKALAAIDGRIELDLVVLWNSDAVFRDVLNEEADIRELQRLISVKPSGESLEDRIMLGRMVALALDKKRDKYAAEILDFLREYTEAFRVNRIVADKMVTNLAFLMRREEQKRFDDRVNELDRRYGGKIDFRCVGPLPPHSFNTMVVERVDFQTVDLARKILGLNEQATMSEIKEAHRKLAVQYHPDRNLDDEGSEDWFRKITKAYRVLIDYCEHYPYSFRGEDVNKYIVVTRLELAEDAGNEETALCANYSYGT